MEDYSDLVNKLKDFNVNYHAGGGGEEEEDGQPAPAAAPVAVGMERGAAAAGLPNDDPLEARIQAFLQREPVILTPRPNFQPILWLSPTMFQPEVTDFKDDVFLHRPAVTLKKLDPDTLAAIGRVTIPQIRAGFTYRGVGSLFVLAYNLHDPKDGTNICVDLDGEEFDKDIDDLSGDQRKLYRVHYAPLPATRNVDKEAQEYCFIAASLLRLFAKPEENYIKSFTQIISGYRRFFHGCGMITSPPAPTLDALRTLKFYFSSSDLFKMTLFRFLYSGGGVKKAVGMRRFLYENYLANTGMHIVGIAEKLVEVLGCSPELLMEAVYHPEFEHQLNRLAIMFEFAGRDDDEEHKRQMWRFGRVFDHNFMASLRTKSCANLTFVLASALKKEDPNSNRDILSIVQLSDLSEEMKRKGDAMATMALRNIRATLMAKKD